MAVRTLWRFIIGKAKTYVQNYNVLERAENVMEVEKRKVAPRHPGTEAKFQVLIKDSKLQEKLHEKSAELLERLKIVKVASKDKNEDPSSNKRELPQDRECPEQAMYGYEEPKRIPEGRFSLRQALELISKYQNNPHAYTVEMLAETYKLKEKDVEDVLTNFRAFELFMPREQKNIPKETLEIIGANKVVRPRFKSKFAHLEKLETPTTPEEKK